MTDERPNAEDYRNRAERAEQALAELAGHDGLSLAVALTQCQAKLATERANADRLAEVLSAVASYHKGEGEYHFANLPIAERQCAMFDAWQVLFGGQVLPALAAHNLLKIDG